MKAKKIEPPDALRAFPPVEKSYGLPYQKSFDEILLQLAGTSTQPVSPRKVLFWGERTGEISSYVSGWLAGKGKDVIVLDGANRFDPYMVSSFARKIFISPERLLKRIRIARAFTCYQMATLIREKLIALVRTIHVQKPWVILLGPISTFLDEDVPGREVRPLFERSLKKIEEMALREIPFLLFQSNGLSGSPSFLPFAKGEKLMNSKRIYLTKRLFQFSNVIWRIDFDDLRAKMILEKGVGTVSHCERLPAGRQVVKQSQGIASSSRNFRTPRNDS